MQYSRSAVAMCLVLLSKCVTCLVHVCTRRPSLPASLPVCLAL